MVWLERVLPFPCTLATLPVGPVEILRRPTDGQDAPAKLPLRDPIRLPAEGEQPIDLPRA